MVDWERGRNCRPVAAMDGTHAHLHRHTHGIDLFPGWTKRKHRFFFSRKWSVISRGRGQRRVLVRGDGGQCGISRCAVWTGHRLPHTCIIVHHDTQPGLAGLGSLAWLAKGPGSWPDGAPVSRPDPRLCIPPSPVQNLRFYLGRKQVPQGTAGMSSLFPLSFSTSFAPLGGSFWGLAGQGSIAGLISPAKKKRRGGRGG